MDDFEEITDKDYVITKDTYYFINGMNSPASLGAYAGNSFEYMAKTYNGIKLFIKNTKPRFKTEKPYPYGY